MASKQADAYRAEQSCRIARVLVSAGGTWGDLAAALDIDLATVQRWRNLYRDFAAALEADGKQDGASPERALARRALGYSLPTEIVLRKRNGPTVRLTVAKHFPPDVSVAELWLSHHPERYTKERLKDLQLIAHIQAFLEDSTDASSGECPLTEYREDVGRRLATIIGRLGGTDVELAEAIGVTLSTLKRWKALHPELIVGLNEGRESLRVAIEDALRQRAVGYRYETEEVAFSPRGNIVRTKRVKQLAPDVRAARILLRSHTPEPEESITLDEFIGNLDAETLAMVQAKLEEGGASTELQEPSA